MGVGYCEDSGPIRIPILNTQAAPASRRSVWPSPTLIKRYNTDAQAKIKLRRPFPAGAAYARDNHGGHVEGGNVTDDSDASYQFGSGIGADEVARLEIQGRALAPATQMILAGAGIRPGMRVLDLGCGAGDATFVAADLVGLDGSVVGVDRSPDALARARLRAGQRGLAQVRCMEGDIHDPVPGGPFDAIIERVVLLWVPDPAAVLRRQATVLRPGGLVVPMETDLTLAWLPETPMTTQIRSWMLEAAARAEISGPGPRLWAIAQEAGLRPLGMIGIQAHFGPDDPVGLAWLTEAMRGFAELIMGTGVATAEEIGIETFGQRLAAEQQRYQAVFAMPVLYGAWATTGPE
jgi:SAM-dependent methyltransferase